MKECALFRATAAEHPSNEPEHGIFETAKKRRGLFCGVTIIRRVKCIRVRFVTVKQTAAVPRIRSTQSTVALVR